MAFIIDNHRYDLLSACVDDYYVTIFREQRLLSFTGMRQPAPVGSTLGLSTVISVMFKGQPARHYRFKIFKGDVLVDSGELDGYGRFSGIKIKIDHNCECVPIDLSNNTSKCLKSVGSYLLDLQPPEAPSEASRQRQDSSAVAIA